MCCFISRTYYQRSLKKYIIDCFIRPQYLAIYKVPYLTFKLGSLWIWLYRVSHGKLGFLNQFWQIYASQILFAGGFEILRPEKFCHHNQFSWNAYILPSNVVGMSIEKLFDMWRNYEFSNFHATYSNLFFWSTKLRQPRQCRDSCTYYIIFQNFVISSFRHIFSIDMPTT